VSEEKTGVQYVREMCETFKEIATTTKFDAVRDKLDALAKELEPMATKLYFKTQKGTEDMADLTVKFEELKSKLGACQEAGTAEGMCIPFYDKLEKIIKHVKTMKVRMT